LLFCGLWARGLQDGGCEVAVQRQGARLPQATTDLDQVKRDFSEFGYGLIRDCLGPDTVAALAERLTEQAAAECEARKAHLADAGRHYYGVPQHGAHAHFQLVRVLPNKGRAFRDLILQPQVTEVMRHGFGDQEFCLSNLTGMVTRGGTPAQIIHCDQSYLPDPVPRAWVNNVLYMISEFTDQNGGTRVIPGSHQWPPPRVDYHPDGRIVGHEDVETIAIEGEPGTAFIFDGRLWHGAGASRTPGPRLAVSGYYINHFLRQSENYPACIHDDVYAQLSDAQKAMLGFKRASTLNYFEPLHEGGRGNVDAVSDYTPEMQLGSR
jgi:ectoine hydroxylase-related dioxygenase (phytanoyl-CoA dioxygenase family)